MDMIRLWRGRLRRPECTSPAAPFEASFIGVGRLVRSSFTAAFKARSIFMVKGFTGFCGRAGLEPAVCGCYRIYATKLVLSLILRD